jgi:transposase InsO family protein
MVCGMPSISLSKNEICKGCMLGKNIKKAFPRNDSRARGILDLVHSDVCGPMSSPPLSGCLYYVIFIDDYSRKCWIYFLKAKSDTFDKFKEYKAFIEKQTGKHIRTLKTDNGGEFESLQFEDFCKETGIKRQLTVPYNPQQNGVAERKNRTICEATKALMFDQDLPNSLWAEATSIVVYIQNRCPHAILKDKTPEEVFSGFKGYLDVMYIFMSLRRRGQRWNPQARKGFLWGTVNSKAYRIYVPGQRKIEVSRDVTFHEEVAFKKSRELQQDSEAIRPTSPSSESEESDVQREEPHEGPSDEPLEPVEELERTLEEPPAKRKPEWLKETMQEAEKIVAPKGTFKESKRPHRFGGYVALMSTISDVEPSSFEEADKLQVWKDAMLEEYRSILKNNVWDIVPRPKDKSVVSSKWIYKIKHAVDGSVEGFTQKE